MKFLLSVFVFILFSTITVSASSITLCPDGMGHPPSTHQISLGKAKVDYTAIFSCKKILKVQFKDLSKGKEVYIGWNFGDGKSLEGTKITYSLKNPIHIFPKVGYYISLLTIKVKGNVNKLWVHKYVILK